ncbi:hypothetical protein BV898_18424 [Hypsibius exemplaris]|uniref:Uncharacterized protein n=1 Tax=Hypsibius exemplaris TaxID=2072580 RepID=A0A9X6NJP6_HYPEX|nr:hypothetical protein BV898_18424 [Hypsibius exemplaris]
MTPAVWKQASLPVRNSGLGIRTTSELPLPAFLASIHSSKYLIAIITPLADFEDILEVSTRDWLTITGQDIPAAPKSQRAWDLPAVEHTVREMTTKTTARNKAQLRALNCKEAEAWIHALPISPAGNLLDDMV